PAVPDQAQHANVDQLLDLSQIGMGLSGGFAPTPEQSTLAVVAHHPQAFYFGTKQGRLKPASETSPDELIKDSPRDPRVVAESLGTPQLDEDPLEGGVAEGEGTTPVVAEY
ncbi:MAG TPA: vitamin B12 dependent-methionine synthase activation domain-containing protein, partial [Baekduia sp.]|nr:vitamin B12 dependent-methionine synthase activation domain-containing protein [Baekduia sp.]